MNESRLGFKVGVFAVISAALIALLILNFSKGVTLGKSTYTLHLTLPNAAGLKPSADVMMAGVPVGKVTTEALADNGRSVDIHMTVLSRYKIRKDSAFRIDSLGFLGDQYVSVIVPDATNTASVEYLKDGDSVVGESSFNIQETVHSVQGVIDQLTRTVRDTDQAITNINASLLSTNTLASFVVAVSNLQVVSARAVGAASRAEALLSTNSEAFHTAVMNFQALSDRLTNTAAKVEDLVTVNGVDVRTIVTNLTETSVQIRQMAADLQTGRGPVGTLLKDDNVRQQMSQAVSNANVLTAELVTFGRDLNERSLWSILFRKHGSTNGLTSEPANPPSVHR